MLSDKATAPTPIVYTGYYVAYPEGFAASKHITKGRERLLLPSPTTLIKFAKFDFEENGIFKRYRYRMSHSTYKERNAHKDNEYRLFIKTARLLFCRTVQKY